MFQLGYQRNDRLDRCVVVPCGRVYPFAQPFDAILVEGDCLDLGAAQIDADSHATGVRRRQ